MVRKFEESKRGDYKIEIECTKGGYEALMKLLDAIKKNGDPGHSFGIKFDDDYPESFGWDGDGWDRISKLSGGPR